MKRTGHLYQMVYDMENLELAHKNAKKGKGWYKEVKMVDANLSYYLGRLQELLINQTYQTSKYETFIKNDTGKERQIYKLPYFPDRICQWAIMQVIEPYLLRHFTKDTYSALPERGIHLCLERLTKAVQTDVDGTEYCLKIDVRKFYPSISHDVLKMKYRRLFKDKRLLWLIDEIIDSTPGATGIPIGNYLSQYSGNFYLSDFDHWIKEEKGIKYYYRYMDDCVILGPDKKALHTLRIEIETYFNDRLQVTLKDNWQVFPTRTRGIDFVGYRVFKDFKLLRKSTGKNFKRKMRLIRKKVVAGQALNLTDYCAVNSYQGWLKHCDSYRLHQKYISPIEKDVKKYHEIYLKKGGQKHGKSRESPKHRKAG